MNKRTKKIIGIFLDIFIVLSYLWIMFSLQTNFMNCDQEGWSKGIKAFKYFTNIGNLLLAISSFTSLIYCILKKQKDKFFRILRLCGVTASTIIMAIAWSTLSLSIGWIVCFKFPAYLFEHTLLPIAALLQFFIFDKKVHLNIKNAGFAVILPGVYALTWIIVLLILNLPPETESDASIVPYFFLAIHNQPVYLTVLYTLLTFTCSFGIAAGFIAINNKLIKK